MQAANDVKFGDRLGVARGRGLKGLFQGHGVCARSVFFAAEGTEPAGSHADVGWVDVAIDVEVRHVAVQALAHLVRQPAQGQDIRRAVERDGIVKVEPLTRKDLFSNRLKARVVSLKLMPRCGSAGGHVSRIIQNCGAMLGRIPVDQRAVTKSIIPEKTSICTRRCATPKNRVIKSFLKSTSNHRSKYRN